MKRERTNIEGAMRRIVNMSNRVLLAALAATMVAGCSETTEEPKPDKGSAIRFQSSVDDFEFGDATKIADMTDETFLEFFVCGVWDDDGDWNSSDVDDYYNIVDGMWTDPQYLTSVEGNKEMITNEVSRPAGSGSYGWDWEGDEVYQ